MTAPRIRVPDDFALARAVTADFAAALMRTGVLAAHPDMIAVLDERVPGWREALGVRCVRACWWLDRPCLYTGDLFADRGWAA